MLIKKILLYFFITFFFYNFAKSQEILIVSKVDDEIITNIDVKVEKKYLLLLNDNLNKLSKKEFSKLAESSLIREIIKKKEIDKSFIKQDKKIENKIVKDFYTKLGFWHVVDWEGLDHFYFIITMAIPFTFVQWRKLLWWVTIFTILALILRHMARWN